MMKSFLISILISTLAYAGPSSNRYVPGQFLKNGSGVYAIPSSGVDQLLGRNTPDILTNKSIDTATNTLTGTASGLTSGNVTTNANLTGDITSVGNVTTIAPGAVTIAKGGTNNGSLGVTAGGVLYTDGSKVMNVGVGTTSNVLISNGGSPPSWVNVSTLTKAPSSQQLNSTGTTTGYFLVFGSSTFAIGDVYADGNSLQYTALTACSSCTSGYFQIATPGSTFGGGANITRVSGAGTATITTSAQTPMATFTTSANTKVLKVTATGAGGAGGGVAVTGAATAAAGSGGGSGATGIKWITSPAATYFYFVGVGGTAGAAGNTAGNAGGASNFNLGAVSGGGGGGGQGGAALGAIGTTQILGAAGGAAVGDIPVPGNFGGVGITLSTTVAMGGIGGPSYWGGAGAQFVNTCNNGGGGVLGGGGGGAVCTNGAARSGAPGGNGIILVEEY